MSAVPPHPDDCREGLREAASRRADARRVEQEAIIDIADWAIRARDAGIAVTEMAEITGLSRRAIYNLIDWREGKRPNRT